MLSFIRHWIPGALAVAGLAIVLVGRAGEASLEVGIPIFSAGASIWFLSYLYRLGVEGDHERDSEAAARLHFARHGRWPGDS